MSVDFSSPPSRTWCDGCGESFSRCRCRWDAELTREGPCWRPDGTDGTDLPDGFSPWDGDGTRSLGHSRWTDLPGIILEAIRHIDDPDQYAEVVEWLESIGYLPDLDED